MVQVNLGNVLPYFVQLDNPKAESGLQTERVADGITDCLIVWTFSTVWALGGLPYFSLLINDPE